MKIVAIETYPVLVPVKPSMMIVSALGEHRESKYVLVRLLTDEGFEGAGEATVMPIWSGETVWGAQALIDRVLAPKLIGMDPSDIASLHAVMNRQTHHNWFAKAAIEMACYDVVGKKLGKPVYELMGGPKRARVVRCRFSMGAFGPDRARQRASELVEQGFQTLKVKVGTNSQADIERVRIVREVAGSDRDLVIDANCGYSAEDAIHVAQSLESARVDLFEQPTPDGDYAAMAQVRRAIKSKVMADDICFNRVHARELIRNECCDVISLYPGKNGGIFNSVWIAEYAAQHGIPCSIGSNLELDIATAAMGHLVVGCENMQVERFPGDMLGPSYHEVSVVKRPIEINGPLVTVPDLPGLGIEVDWNIVKKLALQ